MWVTIKKIKKRNVGDYFILCYFRPKIILNMLVGSFHEDFGEDPWSWTHIKAT